MARPHLLKLSITLGVRFKNKNIWTTATCLCFIIRVFRARRAGFLVRAVGERSLVKVEGSRLEHGNGYHLS